MEVRSCDCIPNLVADLRWSFQCSRQPGWCTGSGWGAELFRHVSRRPHCCVLVVRLTKNVDRLAVATQKAVEDTAAVAAVAARELLVVTALGVGITVRRVRLLVLMGSSQGGGNGGSSNEDLEERHFENVV